MRTKHAFHLLTATIMIMAMVLSLLPVLQIKAGAISITPSQSLSGSGTSEDPFQITDAADLAYLAQQVNSDSTIKPAESGNAVTANTAYYEQTDNIVLNDNAEDYASWDATPPINAWDPIGNTNWPTGNVYHSFKGIYDGKGHTVSGIYIKASIKINGNYFGYKYQGLFGNLTDGTIKNLGVIQSYIDNELLGGYYTGGIVGICEGNSRLINCWNSGIVIGSSWVGGVAGSFIDSKASSNTVMQGCYNTGRITGADSEQSRVGGVVGAVNYNGVNDSCSTVLSGCYNTGGVNGAIVGGIVGGVYAGGIVEYSYNLGTMSGVTSGGIAGYSVGSLQCCYNSGNINGTDNGGIVGYCNQTGTVSKCYSSGSVSSSKSHTGGIAALVGVDPAYITQCYYDKQMCAYGGIHSFDYPQNDVVGKPTFEMTGAQLKSILGDEYWTYTDGLYPRLAYTSGMDSTDAAYISSSPVILASSDSPSSVQSDFIVGGTSDGVNWESNNSGIVSIGNDGNATILNTGSVTLTSSLNGVSKSVTLNVFDTTTPTVCLSSPIGASVLLSTANIGLTFSENVTAVANGAVTISDGSTTYTYTISVDDSYVTDNAASIPISAFKNSSNELLTFAKDTTYTVNISAGAYRDAAGNTVAGGEAGNFTTENVYNVTFDKNGGDTGASPASASVANGGTVTLPTANPTRAGYTFAGWNTKADGTGTAFAAVTPVSADITVFAQWTQNSTGGGSFSGGNSVSTSDTSDNTKITVSTENNTTTATISATAKTSTAGTALAAVTKEEISSALAAAAKKASSQGADKQIIEISVGGTSSEQNVSAAIPQTAFASLAGSSADALTINAPVGSVTFDSTALDAISKNISGSITITVAKTDASSLTKEKQAAIGGRPVYDLKVTSGGKTISDFGGGIATVSVPYKLPEGEDANKIVVYYISDSGELVMVPNCVYNVAAGTVTFTTTHFLAYAVGYNGVSFTDVSGWYEDYVYFLAARDIINGTGNGKFSPDKNITRAQFVAILANLSGDDLSGYTTSSFTDVTAVNWYFKAVQWAYEKGIAAGTDGKFNPNTNITRQNIAVMIARYAEKEANYTLPETNGALTFKDSTDIASYASNAVTAMQRSGIISGNSDGNFAPMANATRAQAAKMIALLLQDMIG